MTIRLFTDLSWEPLRDVFYGTQIYLEIEDRAQPQLEAYLKAYSTKEEIDLENIWDGDSSLDELLSSLRALPFVEKAEHVKYFWPFD